MRSVFQIFAGAFLIIIILASGSVAGQPAPHEQTRKNFRVIGYLPVLGIYNGGGLNFDFGRINYLNIAFLNPDSAAGFSIPPFLRQIVTAAHEKHTKVFISIGGGSAPAYYSKLLTDSLKVKLINNLTKLSVDYNLDGIDVDLEGDRIDTNYEAFVTGLSGALKSKEKLLTAAVATAYQLKYTDKALAAFDFVNIMSYDKTGPWRPADAGPHAPYDMAVADLDYWINTRRIAPQKLSLGLPFYGYGFGPGAPAEISFKNLVAQYPDAEKADIFTVPGGGKIYYNGIETIKNKTELAFWNAGGVMVWQLLGDAEGDKSLLNAINDTIDIYDKH